MFAMPLALPNGRIGGGLDAPSPKPAKLAHDDTAAFKARLSSCTHAPIPLIDDQVAIVLRISFKRDGTLASQPKVLAASLSPDAGILLSAAITALETCQPFAELPPDKYSKWKTLEREAGRDLDPAPDRRIDIEQRDADADNRILHAASMARSGCQFQGSNSAMRLMGWSAIWARTVRR